MKYDTILLDADETLLDFPRSESEAVSDALRLFDITPTEELIAGYSRINRAIWKRLERGEITKAALRVVRFHEFCEQFALTADPERMAEYYLERLSQKAYLLDRSEELCQRLSAKYRLYIITNGIAFVQRGRMARLPITPFFKDIFISEEIGAEKPELLFFERIFEKIPQFSAEKALVVGDSLTSDMRGGIAAGLDTCWYNPKKLPIPEGMEITYTVNSHEALLRLLDA